MRERGRGGDGGRDWGNIDWSNIDLSGFGRGGDRISGPSRRFVILAIVIFLILLIPVLFGATDPVFGRDIGFYFFTLPVLEFMRGWLLVALIVIAIGVVVLYFVRGVIGVATGSLASADIRVAGRTALALARPARAHLSILGGLFLALIAGGYLLDQFDLLFRQETVLVGAGYTSINARLPALTILSVIVGVA